MNLYLNSQTIILKSYVNPYEELSLQSHDRRSEHWIVLEGNAHVQKNNKLFNLKKE